MYIELFLYRIVESSARRAATWPTVRASTVHGPSMSAVVEPAIASNARLFPLTRASKKKNLRYWRIVNNDKALFARQDAARFFWVRLVEFNEHNPQVYKP